MVRKISIIVGFICIFLILAGVILDIVVYLNDPKTHQEYNMSAGIIVSLGICGFTAVLLFLIVNKLEVLGGIGMLVLGLFFTFIGWGMTSEKNYLVAQGSDPYLLLSIMIPKNFLSGVLFLLGGLLAILAGLFLRPPLPQGKEYTSSRQVDNRESKA